jgi:hypothetical protein
LALLFALRPSTAVAQSNADTEAAARLYQEGKERMASGRVAEACPQLAQSNALDPEVGTQLNLARCYELLGKTASAWRTWKVAADGAAVRAAMETDEASRRRASAREAFARARIDALGGGLLFMVLVVVPSEGSEPEIAIDGERVPPGLWGKGMPIDPGVHQITARAVNRREFSLEVDVAPERGPWTTVTIPVLAPAPVPPFASLPTGATASGAPRASNAPPADGSWMRPTAIGAAAGMVAAAAVGTGFGLAAISAHDRAAAGCGTMDCLTARNFRTDAVASDIAFAAAGSLAVAAAILWLSAPSSRPPAAVVAPVVVRDGLTLAVRGAL